MRKVKRVGMVIGIKPERIEEYKALHADGHRGVRDLLEKAHMRNFSIFMGKLDDGKVYLFGTYEYVGEDFEADMADLAREGRIQEWLAMCNPLQGPLEGEESWAPLEVVYFNA